MQLYGRLNHYRSSAVTGATGEAEFLEWPVGLTCPLEKETLVMKSNCLIQYSL